MPPIARALRLRSRVCGARPRLRRHLRGRAVLCRPRRLRRRHRPAACAGAEAIGAALLLRGQGLWQRQRGPRARALWPWASAGKTLTAVAILQLSGEGRLSLDDPIARRVEGVPNGAAITIRHLLDHTSGLSSANEDRAYRADPRVLSLDEELAILLAHGPLFCPGAAWRDSNSNCAPIGAVLERIEGKPCHRVVAGRIARPLGLTRTRVATADDALTDVTPPAAARAGELSADPRRAGPGRPAASSPRRRRWRSSGRRCSMAGSPVPRRCARSSPHSIPCSVCPRTTA